MSVYRLKQGVTDAVPSYALAALRRWAREKLDQIALRHRRHGVWQAWRWADVLRQVERCAEGLGEHRLGAQSRLALCGALEPSLLIIALAAHSLGASSQVLSRHSRGEQLRSQLQALAPDFAFVQRRDDVAHWQQASGELRLALTLISPQATAGRPEPWQVLSLSQLLAGQQLAAKPQLPGAQPVQLRWSQIKADKVVWVDEGTEWAEGLEAVLARWLKGGEGFAFPETLESASRDRAQINPTALLLSAPRAQALADEIEARLAPPGSWRRRLCDWTLRDPQRGVRRWIKARVRGLLGFGRLAGIDGATPAATVARRPSWLDQHAERAA